MFSLDCTACPAPPGGCEGCLVDLLCVTNSQLEAISEVPCGYVLSAETRAAIDVLRAAGLLSEVRIVDVSRAA